MLEVKVEISSNVIRRNIAKIFFAPNLGWCMYVISKQWPFIFEKQRLEKNSDNFISFWPT
jgi:hypothetical protein